MKKTKIDWADSTWNPVTGCFHKCEYCYARRIAERFGLSFIPKMGDPGTEGFKKRDSEEGLDTMLELECPYIKNGKVEPYPAAFNPTFHKYRLNEYKEMKGRTIFVCSMADLFGKWVPDEWIESVFEACINAPQHRYLFLTKNSFRYSHFDINGKLPNRDNFWYGTTITTPYDAFYCDGSYNTFISIEPILQDFGHKPEPNGLGSYDPLHLVKWAIIGAETGKRIGKVSPQKEWIDNLVARFDEGKVPVFMKDSIRELMGDDFRQEFPWGGVVE